MRDDGHLSKPNANNSTSISIATFFFCYRLPLIENYNDDDLNVAVVDVLFVDHNICYI